MPKELRNSNPLGTPTERQIYGSARLGSLKTKVDVFGTAFTAYSDVITTHAIGDRNYELSNHLGNVLTVISDKLHSVDDGNGDVACYPEFLGTSTADLVMSCDYSPFGVTLDGRGVEGSYRYGYQGSEKDDEVKGDGNSYTTMFRQLDPRVGRWLSIDPLAAQFPWQSPYVSMDNSPIWLTDIAGSSTTPGGENQDTPAKTVDVTGYKKLDLPNNVQNVQGTVTMVPISKEDLHLLQDSKLENLGYDIGFGYLAVKVQTVESFEIDGVRYSAKFGEKGFLGYWDDSGGRYGGVDRYGNYAGNSYEATVKTIVEFNQVAAHMKNIPDDFYYDEIFGKDALNSLLGDLSGVVLDKGMGQAGVNLPAMDVPNTSNAASYDRHREAQVRYYLANVAGPGSVCSYNTSRMVWGNDPLTGQRTIIFETTKTTIRYFGVDSKGNPVFLMDKTIVNPNMAKK